MPVCRNPLKIRASLGLDACPSYMVAEWSQSLKDQGKSRTEFFMTIAQKFVKSQSLKDQGKSRTRSLSSEEIAFIVAIP